MKSEKKEEQTQKEEVFFSVEAIAEPYTEEDLEDLKSIKDTKHESSVPIETLLKKYGLESEI